MGTGAVEYSTGMRPLAQRGSLRCGTLLRASLLVLATAGALTPSASAGSARQATVTRCGFSLEVPAGWRMRRTPNREVKCWFYLESVNRKDQCSVLVRAMTADFASAATEAGFEQRDNEWVINEEWNETIKADPISGAGWTGIKAEHVVRDTGTVGTIIPRETWVAVLSADGQHSATITSSDCRDERFDAVVQSFRFLPALGK